MNISTLRKSSTIIGGLFFLLSVIVGAFTSYDDLPIIKNFLDETRFFILPRDWASQAGFYLALIYFIANAAFYFLSWSGGKLAIPFFVMTYTISIAFFLVEWSPIIQLGVISLFDSISCVADGVIFCCLLLSNGLEFCNEGPQPNRG